MESPGAGSAVARCLYLDCRRNWPDRAHRRMGAQNCLPATGRVVAPARGQQSASGSNVSPRQFHHPDFVERVKSIVSETGVNPRLLELEITEGLLLLDIEDTISKMEKLKQSELGIGFTLDDFGIGYSSLAYLQRLPLDQLKIDRSFLVNIFMNKNDAAIVRSIIALAHSMSLKVVAEGVETKPQRDFLHKLGCTSCQGYYFGAPKVAKDLPFIPKTTGA